MRYCEGLHGAYHLVPSTNIWPLEVGVLNCWLLTKYIFLYQLKACTLGSKTRVIQQCLTLPCYYKNNNIGILCKIVGTPHASAVLDGSQ